MAILCQNREECAVDLLLRPRLTLRPTWTRATQGAILTHRLRAPVGVHVSTAMTTYRWVCHLCNATNPPESIKCEVCGFPAEATGEEIELARTAGTSAAVDVKRQEHAKVRATWKAQPLWLRAFELLLGLIFVSGFVLAQFWPAVEGNILGLVIIGAAVGIMFLANAARKHSK